jgi:glycosyltransferase involved in cell wall biosynthesis
MSPLVSIIIPCYNAAKWVGSAIESALAQTYQNCEVVVIDDGSTDASLEVIKSFAQRICWETVDNGGGCAARNRGFELSNGKVVQFLDADDYLLQTKIESQVHCLEEGADVVYSDWRHQFHQSDGTVRMGDTVASQNHRDILTALLGGWWVAPCAVLARRSAVERIDGWDESLKAAQDRDFMIRLAASGAKFVYEPGCESVYRRYGNVTVSTGNLPAWLESHHRVLQKAEQALRVGGRLTQERRRALACSYFSLARNYFDRDRSVYRRLMDEVRSVDPEFRPRESAFYNAVQRMVGFETAETLAAWKRRLRPPV